VWVTPLTVIAPSADMPMGEGPEEVVDGPVGAGGAGAALDFDEAAGGVDEAPAMMDDACDGVMVTVLVLCGGAVPLGRASCPSVSDFVSMKAMVGPATS